MVLAIAGFAELNDGKIFMRALVGNPDGSVIYRAEKQGDFKNPVEIGELVILKASVNYVGKTSMIVGIRVTSEHTQTGIKKHCNSSYFTMVAKDENGNNVKIPRLILSNMNEVRRFYDGVNRINNKKKHKELEINFDYQSAQALENLKNYHVIDDNYLAYISMVKKDKNKSNLNSEEVLKIVEIFKHH